MTLVSISLRNLRGEPKQIAKITDLYKSYFELTCDCFHLESKPVKSMNPVWLVYLNVDKFHLTFTITNDTTNLNLSFNVNTKCLKFLAKSVHLPKIVGIRNTTPKLPHIRAK
jgi:hypothetical protein